MATTCELVGACETSRMHVWRLAQEGGPLRRLAQGVFTLPDLRLTPADDMLAVLKRAPRGVICGPSAAWIHGLTSVPTETVWLAIGARAWLPSLGELNAEIVRWSDPRLMPAKHLRPKFNQLRVADIRDTLLTCVHAHRRIGMPLVKKIFDAAQKKGVVGRPTMIAVNRALRAAGAFPRIVRPPFEQFLVLR